MFKIIEFFQKYNKHDILLIFWNKSIVNWLS